MIRVLGLIVAGTAWLLLWVLAGLYVTFPRDTVRDRIEWEVDQSSNHDYALSMEGLSPWWRLGVVMDEVTVYSVKKGRRTKDNPKPPHERKPLITLDSLGVRLSPLALATGKKGFAWSGEVYGGDIGGSYAASETVVELAVDVEDVDLSRMAADGGSPLNLLGTLEVEAELRFDLEDIKASTGSIRIEIPGFAIGPGTTVGGFGLPEATFTKASLALAVENGKMVVSEGVIEGPVLSAEVSGDITLNKRVSRSRNRLDLAFTLPEEFDQLAQLSPSLKRSKDEEGRYHCQMSGTVVTPTFRCGKSSVSRFRAGEEEGGIAPTSRLRSPEGGDELDDEERRKQREERIKERRERLRAKREAARARDGTEDGGDMPPREPFEPRDLPEGVKPPPGLDLPPLDDMEPPPFEPPPGDEEPPPDEEFMPE